MQLHLTATGAVRIGLSRRNAARLLAYAVKDPETSLGMESGDVYVDGTPSGGHLSACIANASTGSTEPTVLMFGSRNHLRLLCSPAWLLEQIALVDTGERPESQIGRATVYVESDELHYAYRPAGYAADHPLPE